MSDPGNLPFYDTPIVLNGKILDKADKADKAFTRGSHQQEKNEDSGPSSVMG